MNFLKFLKPKTINDELIGKDEKVCSCSVRIAEILQQSSEEEEKNIQQTINRLKIQPSQRNKHSQ